MFTTYRKLVVFFLIIILFSFGCAINKPKDCIKDGKAYGFRGIFRGKFWNYYQAGLSYAEGFCLNEAAMAFSRAIDVNPKDNRYVTTYGMNYIQYYPHRELGIIRFYQNNYKDAIPELKQSLNNCASGRALFFLNASLKTITILSNNDHEKPEIKIISPKAFLSNQNNILVSGIVSDNTYVESITVNSQAVAITEFSKEISFEMPLKFQKKENEITICATDVAGNSKVITQKLTIDTLSPIISVGPLQKTDQNQFRITAACFDQQGILWTHLKLNNTKIRTIIGKADQIVHIEEIVQVDPLKDKLVVETKDLSGNLTFLDIFKHKVNNIHMANYYRTSQPIYLASNDFIPFLVQKNNTSSIPVILKLDGYKDKQDVYMDELYLSANIFSDTQVKTIIIYHNKNVIGKFESNRFLHNGNQIVVPFHVVLEPGQNDITLEAHCEETKKKTYLFNKKNFDSEDVSMTVALVPKENAIAAEGDIEGTLLEALVNTNRFNMQVMKNLKAVMDAQKKQCLNFVKCYDDGLTQAPLWIMEWKAEEKRKDRYHNIKEKGIGMDVNVSEFVDLKIKGSEKDMIQIQKIPYLDIEIRIVDVENSVVVTSSSKYAMNYDIGFLKRKLCQEIVRDLIRKVPVVKATIQNIKKRKIYINAGKNKGIKKGMRIIVFDNIQMKDATGAITISDIEIKGEAIIHSVRTNTSVAIVRQKEYLGQIGLIQNVLTR